MKKPFLHLATAGRAVCAGLALCTAAVAALAPVPLLAATEKADGVVYTYFVANGKATIGDGKTAAIDKKLKTAIAIPSKLGGCPVTAIAPYAFYECSITSATIPDGVTSVGEWAFRECTGLKSVSLPSTVSVLQAQVFGNTGLTSITLPHGLKKIASEAFDHLECLKSVMFPASLKEMEDWAFMDCYVLSTFTFLGNAPKTGSQPFYYCPVDKMTASVPKSSTGWGVSIPGKWHGMKIDYSPDPSPLSTATYTIKFNANGGKGKMSNQKMLRDKAAKLKKAAFSRSGHVFIGWAKSKKGAVAYKNKASVTNLAAAGKTVNLYAKWAKKTYKVKFVANGGKGKMAVQKMTYGKAKKLSANKFAKEGYSFAGWAKSAALAKKGEVAYKNKKSVKNLVKNGKTVKLYAVWKKKTSTGKNTTASTSDTDPSSTCSLSFCGLTFATDAKYPWSATTVDGKSALASAPIGDNGKSTLYLTVTGPGTFSCKLRVLSQPGCDQLVFTAPGLVRTKSGIVGNWDHASCSIPSGTHVLTWTYEKDASGSASSDCGWIADVVWQKQ